MLSDNKVKLFLQPCVSSKDVKSERGEDVQVRTEWMRVVRRSGSTGCRVCICVSVWARVYVCCAAWTESPPQRERPSRSARCAAPRPSAIHSSQREQRALPPSLEFSDGNVSRLVEREGRENSAGGKNQRASSQDKTQTDWIIERYFHLITWFGSPTRCWIRAINQHQRLRGAPLTPSARPEGTHSTVQQQSCH